MSAKKIGKPLGGVGAENMQKRKFNLVLDDRLLSKQYVKERILDNTSNEAFGTDWASETEKAPSKQAVFNYLSSLSVETDNWVEESTGASGDLRLFKTGNVGIGNGNSMDFSDVTHKLTVAGDIRATDEIGKRLFVVCEDDEVYELCETGSPRLKEKAYSDCIESSDRS